MTIKEIEKGKENQVMNYLINKCNMLILSSYNNQHPELTSKILNIVISDNHYSKENIIKNYSEEFIDKICETYKDDERIFDSNYNQLYEKYSVNMVVERKTVIKNAIDEVVYKYYVDLFISKHKKDIIKVDVEQSEQVIGQNFVRTHYYFKLTPQLKTVILESNLCDWCFPKNLEDLTFVENNFVKFFSISHEKIYDIYCSSEEEYIFLKTLGINFYDDLYDKEEEKIYIQ